MIDLFTASMSIEEQIEDLKTNIKESYIKQGRITKKTRIKLFFGDLKNIGNNILIISAPPPARLFDSPEDGRLKQFIQDLGIGNFFLTYFYLLLDTKISRKEIKDFSPWIQKLTDLIDPKLIVCMGEEAQFSYFKKKFLLRDHHGTQIGEYNSIPIIASYPIFYYQKSSEFEDTAYKDFMKAKDWGYIQQRYKEKIC
jgi:hypothetical protein